jgi:hypothetical protein
LIPALPQHLARKRASYTIAELVTYRGADREQVHHPELNEGVIWYTSLTSDSTRNGQSV